MDPEIPLKGSPHGMQAIYATAGYQMLTTAVPGSTGDTERSEPELTGGKKEIMDSVRN